MKPHMAHIAQTVAKKQAAEKAKESSYENYWQQVQAAFKQGYTKDDIINQLENEIERIEDDEREGDSIFQVGLRNAKSSCVNAIDLIISELRGND